MFIKRDPLYPLFRLSGWIGFACLFLIGAKAQFVGLETIDPGKGIGQVRLGETRDEVIRSLGEPKLSDAAMGGKVLDVWRSGPAFAGRRQNGIEELDLYFTKESIDLSGQPIVRQIRVTSPFFRTPSGISVRSSFEKISREFPNLSIDEELTYRLGAGRSEKEIEMYVDRSRGIAFELRRGAQADPDAGGYCRAIHIFQPNTNPRALQSFAQAAGEE